MPCFHPLQAYQCVDGSVVFSELKRHDVVRSLSLPCGQCVGCRLERSRQWAIRCMHEASLYKQNCFITLTYNNESLPDDRSLHYDHFQKFMKRLRKKYPHKKIRFYMCGEYGENFNRPHFHACLFNHDFGDKKPWKRSSKDCVIYRSADLESLWTYGFSSIGDVTFESAAYVARYIMKKINGDLADDRYKFVDETSGEIHNLRPEFNKMSLKPGIGQGWLDKYQDDVYPHDYVVVNGKAVKPPKFYDRKFSDLYPVEFDMIKLKRELDGRSRFEDNTDVRLEVKERIAYAKLGQLSRTID